MRKLLFVCFICFFFMCCEVVGGIISGSLAILTDAAHMFSDVSGFLISYFAILVSQGKSSHSKSMGYHRAEILGAILAIINNKQIVHKNIICIKDVEYFIKRS